MPHNQYPLPEDPKAMISHFEEFKAAIVADAEADPEYAEQAQFSLSCVENILAALHSFESSKQADLRAYVSIIAHLELFNSIFAEDSEEDDEFFFDFEEGEEEAEEGHHHEHGDSCCHKKSPCDSKDAKKDKQ